MISQRVEIIYLLRLLQTLANQIFIIFRKGSKEANYNNWQMCANLIMQKIDKVAFFDSIEMEICIQNMD